MTLFCNRYKITVTGADGLMRSAFASHHIEVLFVRFLLEKKSPKPVKRVVMTDTYTGNPVTKTEYHAA